MRVVFDSNVLIAAFSSHGLCHSLFELCLRNQQIVISDHILDEVERKLRQKLKVPVPTVRETISYLKKHCVQDKPVPVPPDACRDPKDLAILGLAVGARAHCLVSGDKDLLILKRHHETDILSPRQLYDRLRQK